MGEESTERYFSLQREAAKLALLGKAGQTGGFVDYKPYCDNPPTVWKYARGGSGQRSLEVARVVPCRKCAKCLQFRAMQWRERIEQEIHWAKGSWFVTLTFSELHLAGILMEAALGPTLADQDAEIDRAAYRHLRLYLDRVRKVPHTFRYFAVFERGEKKGRPHYHLIIHDHGARPLSAQILKTKWRSRVDAQIVEEGRRGLPTYLTKYLTKSLSVSPRASVGYGRSLPAHLTARAEHLGASPPKRGARRGPQVL